MVGDSDAPNQGVDLAAARKILASAAIEPLAVDFLAVDETGHIGVFLGAHPDGVPSRADPDATAAALDAIARAVSLRASATIEVAYRDIASRAPDPIFDRPRVRVGEPLHERPFDGYPHLLVALEEKSVELRTTMTAFGGREAIVREAFGAIIDSLDGDIFDALHARRVCAGCRALDDANDPHPRSPQALAAAGLYVYARGADAWMRVASPSVAGDVGDLRELGVASELPRRAMRFEASDVLRLDAIGRRIDGL